MESATLIQITPEELEQLIEKSVSKAIGGGLLFPTEDTSPGKRMFLKDAAVFLGMAEQTLYQNRKKLEIPSHRIPGAGRLIFFENELTRWLCSHNPDRVDKPASGDEVPAVPPVKRKTFRRTGIRKVKNH